MERTKKISKKLLVGLVLLIGAVIVTSGVLLTFYVQHETDFDDVDALWEWDNQLAEDLVTNVVYTDFIANDTIEQTHYFNASADIDNPINTSWTWDDTASVNTTEGLTAKCYVNVSGAGEYLLVDDTEGTDFLVITASDTIVVRLVFQADPYLKSGDYQWELQITENVA